MIYVDKYASVGIINLDTGEETWYWGKESVLDDRSSILLYILTDNFEWLIYKTQNTKKGFFLSTVPKKHPAYNEIVKRVDALQHFKAYAGMAELAGTVNSNKTYKRLETYVIEVDECRDKMNFKGDF